MRRRRIEVYGTRGSAAVSSPEFRAFGGDTSCFLYRGAMDIVLDAGTGLVQLAKAVKTSALVIILLSHYHLDHIIGLGMCEWFQNPGMEIHIYGPVWQGKGCAEILEEIFKPPYWPISLTQMTARIHMHDIAAGDTLLLSDNLQILSILSNHSDGCLAYRLEEKNPDGITGKFGYMLDFEYEEASIHGFVEFMKGCDALLFDGGFLPSQRKKGWGHSSWDDGIEFMHEARIKKLIMAHYGISCDDAVLYEQEALAQKTDGRCYFAKTNSVFEL